MSAIPLKPDLAISLATATAILARAGRDAAVVALSLLHGGEISAVCELVLSDASALVLKIYPDSMSWKMRKEARLLDLVRDRLPVPAPRLLLADGARDLVGLDYILISKLAGELLGPLEPRLSDEQRHSAFAQVGRLSHAFHHIPMEAFGYIGPEGIWTAHATNRAYLTLQFDRKLTEFKSRGGEAALAARVARHVAEHSDLFAQCQTPVLCHNDLHPGNVLALVEEGAVRLTGVVDFEGALAGDPLKDVAKALYYLKDRERRAFLAGYGPIARDDVEPTLALYRLLFSLELWCWHAQFGAGDKLAPLVDDVERLLAR